MNRRMKAVTASGIVVLISSLILFFILIDDISALKGVVFCFLLVGEIVLFSGIYMIEVLSQNVSLLLFRLMAYTALIITAGINIIMSIIYLMLQIQTLKLFLAVQFVLYTILIVLFIIGYATAKGIVNGVEKDATIAQTLDGYINQLAYLKNDNKTYYEDIRKLEEALKYSDTSVMVSSDEKFKSLLNELDKALKNQVDLEVKELLEEGLRLVQQRKMEIKSLKTGGI